MKAQLTLLAFRSKLRRWFLHNARDLPWRNTRNPYRIWISEIMLQQTTVAAVVPFFERFLARFPTVLELASADEAEVLLLWQGLGYYSRARNIHRTAKILVAEYQSEFPRDPVLAAELPGIGRYMIGAILSQAFEVRLPIVESNTRRLYARLYARFDLDLTGRDGQAWLWQTAGDLLPRKGIGNFNQALMELGALVCKPKPRCNDCPVSKECVAFQNGESHRLPNTGKKPAFTELLSLTLAVAQGEKYLIVQRGPMGRWANMWEFPTIELAEGETELKATRRLLKELCIRVKLGGEIAVISHGVTRFKIRMVCRDAKLIGPLSTSENHRWIPLTDMPFLPMSTAMRKLADTLALPRQLHLFPDES